MKVGNHIAAIIALAGSLLVAACINAQKIQPLKIGDPVPDIEFEMRNGKVSKSKLSDFKGKLIILDFWATWCGSCTDKFPKLDSLQSKFKENVRILLVNTSTTRDTEKKIGDFFNRWEKVKGKAYSLPTAINDRIAKGLFPHKFIPHYVWIGPNGKVKAITSADDINEKNIEKLLHNESVSMAVKKDFDNNRFLYLGDDITMNEVTHYALLIKGEIKGLGPVNDMRYIGINKRVLRGWTMRNQPLLSIYRIILSKLMPGYTDKNLVLEIGDSSRLFFEKSKLAKSDWDKDNLYTFDIVVPIAEAGNLNSEMLKELNHYSDYLASIEERNVKCLVLVQTGKEDKIKSANGKADFSLRDSNSGYVKNLPITYVVKAFNALKTLSLPVVDETNYTGKVDIVFSAGELKDLTSIRNALQRYNLDLIEAERKMEMFVVREKSLPGMTLK